MIWLMLIILVAVGSMTQLTIQADIRHDDGTQGRVRVQWWKLHKAWTWNSRQPRKLPQQRMQLLQRLLSGDKRALLHLLKHCRLEALYMLVLLHTKDAAKSALLSGTLGGMIDCVPALHKGAVHIRVLPEFFREHSTINFRCIIRVKAGILILTAGMLALRFLAARQLKEREAM